MVPSQCHCGLVLVHSWIPKPMDAPVLSMGWREIGLAQNLCTSFPVLHLLQKI